MDINILLTVIGGLVALTNIVVEVLKKVVGDKLPTSILALVIGEILTISACVAYWQINDVALVWYRLFGSFVGGFAVAYAAMFGFDKLKEIINSYRGGASK